MSHRLLILMLFLALGANPVRAQDPAPPGDPVAKALRDVHDETRPLSFRAQIVARLLAGRTPAALAELRRTLMDSGASADLRLVIATGSLTTPGLPLFDAVLEILGGEDDGGLIGKIRRVFCWAPTPELVDELSRRAGRGGAGAVPAIELLGETGVLLAVPPLLDLWEKGDDEVGAAARRALFRIVPVEFETPAQARLYFEEAAKRGLRLADILREELSQMQDGGRDDSALVSIAGAVLDQASLDSLIQQYLGCAESAEVRRMGVERLRTYPFAEREKGREAEARRAAAAAVLDGLRIEKSTENVVAFLNTLRALVGAVRDLDAARATKLALARVDGTSMVVRLAALGAIGDLGDRSVIPHLCRRYDLEEGPESVKFRLAVLDALEKLGDGIADWVLDRLSKKPEDESLTLRLVQLLKRYEDHRDSIPVLAEILQAASAERVRQEAALALGLIGARAGDAEAIDALAVTGLADPDSSVRAISATQLGRAPEVEDKVIGLLRERLKDQETVARVKTAAAWSLLKLRGTAAIPWLASLLRDNEVWNEAFRNYLNVDVLAAGRAGEAEHLVEGLFLAKADGRCVEAARRVLDAKNLTWEGESKGGRTRVVTTMAEAYGRMGKPAEGLAVLAAEEQSVDLSGPAGRRFRLARGRLLRAGGEPEKALEVLRALLGEESLNGSVASLARLETARAYLALSRPDDAEKALEPALEDRDLSAQAEALREKIREMREAAPTPPDPAGLVKGLDAADAEVRSASIAGLRKLGAAAYPALLAWLDAKPAGEIASAVRTVEAATGLTLPYDPEASEEDRAAALAAIREQLQPGD